MAETAHDLTDDQIEQLLSAAEASLANKSSGKEVALKTKHEAIAVTAPAPTAQPGRGNASKDVVSRSEELMLRVPQLKSKDKKVQPPPPYPSRRPPL